MGRLRRGLAITAILLAALGHGAPAQPTANDVGEVATCNRPERPAAMCIDAEARHEPNWADVDHLPWPVFIGDELRTQKGGQMRVKFENPDVLIMDHDTHIAVMKQPMPGFQQVRGLELRLGRVRVLASRDTACSAIDTPTTTFHCKTTQQAFRVDPSLAGVLRCESTSEVSHPDVISFVVSYSADGVTEVIGLSGSVEVNSVRDPTGHTTVVTAGQATTVLPGQFPSPSQPANQAALQQALTDLTFIGGGKPESLTVDHPILTGTTVFPEDRTSGLAGMRPFLGERRDVSPGDILHPPFQLTPGEAGIEF